MLRKIAFIVNPNSGNDRVKSIRASINKFFDKNIFETKIIFTEYAGHATQLACNLAAQCYETVVAVGGDGTANEVACGLIGSGTSLGLLPKGSGNGLARASKIPLDMDSAMQIIARGYVSTIDVGTINNKIFLSNAGTGLDAHVALKCKNESKRGLYMYIRNTFTSFRKYSPRTYTITYDGITIKQRAIMISVANGNEFGYGFKIAPTAKNNDGLLDIMIIHPLNFFTASRVSFKAWYGNLHKYSKVTYLRAKEITITSSDLDAFQVDGDGFQATDSLDISLQHKKLQLIVP